MTAENIRKEFSLDHYDSLLVNHGMARANAYRMLFVNQRRLNKLETELSLDANSKYSAQEYNTILNEKGLAEADLYREYYQIKNQMIKDLNMLNMGTDEEYDDSVDLDPTTVPDAQPTTNDATTTVVEDPATDPIQPANTTDTVNQGENDDPVEVQDDPIVNDTPVEDDKPAEDQNPTEDNNPVEDHEVIEDLRQKYQELYGKPVANLYKNNAEWIKGKINEYQPTNEDPIDPTPASTDPVEVVENKEANPSEVNPSDEAN